MAAQLLGGVSDILGEEDQYDQRRFVVGSLVDVVTNLADMWEDQPTQRDGSQPSSQDGAL